MDVLGNEVVHELGQRWSLFKNEIWWFFRVSLKSKTWYHDKVWMPIARHTPKPLQLAVLVLLVSNEWAKRGNVDPNKITYSELYESLEQ